MSNWLAGLIGYVAGVLILLIVAIPYYLYAIRPQLRELRHRRREDDILLRVLTALERRSEPTTAFELAASLFSEVPLDAQHLADVRSALSKLLNTGQISCRLPDNSDNWVYLLNEHARH